MNPPTGHELFPKDAEGQEVWITPLFMHDIWEMRRTKELLLGLFGGTAFEPLICHIKEGIPGSVIKDRYLRAPQCLVRLTLNRVAHLM